MNPEKTTTAWGNGLVWGLAACAAVLLLAWIHLRMSVFYTPATRILGEGVDPAVARALERYLEATHHFDGIQRPLDFNGGDFLHLLDPRNGPANNHLRFEREEGNIYSVEVERTSGGHSGGGAMIRLKNDGKGGWIFQSGRSQEY